MKKRVISAAVLLTITGLCVFLSDITRVLFFTVAGILCAWELCKNLKDIEIHCAFWVMASYLIISTFLSLIGAGVFAKIACFCVAVYLAMFSGIISRNVKGNGALYSVAGLSYPCVLFVITFDIVISDIWLETLIAACISSWCCDAFALFGGKRFGRHKLAPDISPNKTIEGSICGALSSVIIAIPCYFLYFKSYRPDMPWYICILIFFVASTMGQIGDLAESLIKRTIGVKDFSNLIPGHGGMFDRADSLLFAIPTAYFLFKLLMI